MINARGLGRFLNKAPGSFTRKDLIRFINRVGIEIINFRYVGGDGRLKTLSFSITNKRQLDNLLARGERVDGSSLFSYIDAASSDLYVIPRYKTAYVNPFSEIPALDILCSFYTQAGTPLPSAPENVVRRAHQSLKERTGLSLEMLGELEYYVLAGRQPDYPMAPQSGYHGSAPFAKWEALRAEAMQLISRANGRIKYGHTEVGHIGEADVDMEQHEIEFDLMPIEDAADQIVIARWILRMLGYKYGVTISFAPKIAVGHAGSGLHIHSRLVKGNQNTMIKGGILSDHARRMIAGYLELAGSLTAFGNTVPLSYWRLVPGQEAPTSICWGECNRSVLVRVPLGWVNVKDMVRDANPEEKTRSRQMDKQTVELRSPDGSADIYFLLAGLAVAARHGLEMKNSLSLVKHLCVDNHPVRRKLPRLPASCWESAERLIKDRRIYERDNVFSSVVIDGVASKLKGYGDKQWNKNISGSKGRLKKLIKEYLYCS